MFLLLAEGGCNTSVLGVVLYCLITGQEVPHEIPGFLLMLSLLRDSQVEDHCRHNRVSVCTHLRYSFYRRFLV